MSGVLLPIEGSTSPGATVIVPALNEEAFIGVCLKSLADQTLLPERVVVVDGCSSDSTVAVVEALAPDLPFEVMIVSNPDQRVPSALNLGLQNTQTEFVFKLSAHAQVNSVYLESLCARLGEGWDGVGGRKTAIGNTAQGEANASALSSKLGVGASSYHYATKLEENVSHVPSGGYRTSMVRELGGWDESLPVNQDFEFDFRLRTAGGRLCIDPTAESYWRCKDSLGGLSRQYRRYGAGKAAVVRRHPRSAAIRHLAPSAALVACAQMLLFRRGRRLLVMMVGSYVLAILAESARLEMRAAPARPSRLARRSIAFPVMHLSFGTGVIEGALGRQHSSQLPGGDQFVDRGQDLSVRVEQV